MLTGLALAKVLGVLPPSLAEHLSKS